MLKYNLKKLMRNTVRNTKMNPIVNMTVLVNTICIKPRCVKTFRIKDNAHIVIARSLIQKMS